MPLNSFVGKYRSKDGRHYFEFQFVPEGDHLVVYCLDRPSVGGQDPNPQKTHVFDSGKICFVEGQEPRSRERAEELVCQWAEYFLDYRRTGMAKQ